LKYDLTVLSLNTFGVPFYLSWGRLARLVDKLEGMEPTVICLQEIQQNAYASLLVHRLPTYPYRAIFPYVFAPKGGLGTFSRLPLRGQQFELYQDRGLRWLITFSDWSLFKGVLIAILSLEGLDVFIINTHMNANYSGDWRPQNPLAHTQHQQVQQLARLVEGMPAEALIVLCGDFNFPRASFLYQELISQTGLFDLLRDDPRPTYRPFPLVPSKWNISLDYMLLRIPEGVDVSLEADIVQLEDTSQKSPFRRFLTDHHALTLTVSWPD
jgi:endonuclease/exonuclease/phosphatase family metal-dependent hydrolase